MIEIIAIIISICISIISIIISILTYIQKVPRLKISIVDEIFDCFFGNVRTSHNNYENINRISGIRIRLVNSSPTPITIINIKMICNKETFRFIDNSNEFWSVIEFLYLDKTGIETSDGCCISYIEEGLQLPYIIKENCVINPLLLFYYFPIKIKGKIKAKLMIDTSIGKKCLKCTLKEYDNRYTNEEWKEIEQFQRSL